MSLNQSYVKPLAAALALLLISTTSHAQLLGPYTCGKGNFTTQVDYSHYAYTIKPIVAHMTLEQKIGQMTLPDLSMLPAQPNHYATPAVLDPAYMQTYALGGILVSGNAAPFNCDNFGHCQLVMNPDVPASFMNATMHNWKTLAKEFSATNVVVDPGNGKLAYIKPLLGTDAVHGNQHVLGEVLFPQNIGLAATHDPKQFYQAGYWTAYSVQQSGFNWIYAPTVAVSQSPNWGRFYETLGSELNALMQYSYCFAGGAQQANVGYIRGTLTTAKHYLGDGGTWDGADEGDVKLNLDDTQNFMNVNTAGYLGAIYGGAGSAMVSYSAINGVPMSINDKFLPTLFTIKIYGYHNSEPFAGFTVSDYGAIDKAASQGLPATPIKMPYQSALAKSLNAGMDMFMLSPWTPNEDVATFQQSVKTLVENSKYNMLPAVSESVIDEAVTRILSVKYALGLIQNDKGKFWNSEASPDQDGQTILDLPLVKEAKAKAAADALQAAEESLVLLKNENNVLPLQAKKIKYVVLVGEDTLPTQNLDGSIVTKVFQNFDNLGAQNGGWTIRWQGFNGNDFWDTKTKQAAHATSILDGINNIVGQSTQVLYAHYQDATNSDLVAKDRTAFLKQLQTALPNMTSENTVVIAALAEPPYAEFMGDINIPYCQQNSIDASNGCLYNQHLNVYLPKQQKSTSAVSLDSFSQKITSQLQAHGVPVVTVVLSGRPVIINDTSNGFTPLTDSQALVEAWLPGTSGGQAVANALFGDYLFCHATSQENGICQIGMPNTLPVDWPANMQQLVNFPVYDKWTYIPSYRGPLFNMNYGLATKPKN
jgi:beta-glucosidase